MIDFNLPEAEYHALPSLSSTGARRMLESPAKYRHMVSHPQPAKAAFDLGTAVHSRVLGVGAPTVTIPDEFLGANGATSTSAAKAFIAEARSNGQTPVKADVAATVNAMAEAILAHPTARVLLERPGNPEASVLTTDPETGVDIRARFDFLPDLSSPNPVAVDLKTSAKDASREGFTKTIANLGYDVQEAHYEDALLFDQNADIPFVFVVVETEAPHLVAVHQIDSIWRQMGHTKARRARELFAECTATGEWPGYPSDVQLVTPPTYAIYQHEEKYA